MAASSKTAIGPRRSGMRADALKNRQRIIDATVELVLKDGGDPARDAVATRAGLGIGTLYRHFPDQQSLLHAVVRSVLQTSIETGEALVEAAPDGVEALRRYMHAALDGGIGVVNILYPLLDKPHWPDLHSRASRLMNSIISRAKLHGTLRSDLAERDIALALTRFARPLAVGLDPEKERALAHRHLDFYIDGLCAEQPQPKLTT